MPYTVHIRSAETGEARAIPFDEDWQDATAGLWEVGNYMCDCNRSLFFRRAAGEPDDDVGPCGTERFSVTINLPDGSVVYEDD